MSVVRKQFLLLALVSRVNVVLVKWVYVVIPVCLAVGLAGLTWREFNSPRMRLNLRRAYLSGDVLSGRNLSYAELQDADLRDARLAGADLTGAQLSGANLTGADFQGAELSGANLRGADLTRAVNLTAEQIAAAVTDETTTLPAALVGRPAGQDRVENGTEVSFESTFIDLPFRPHKVALSAGGTTLASVGQTKGVHLWQVNAAAFEELPTKTGQEANGRSVVISPDGRTVAAGSEDGVVRLWRVAGGDAPLTELKAARDEGYVFFLEYDRRGATLVSASRINPPVDTKTVRVWELGGNTSTSGIEIGAAERLIDIDPEQKVMALITPPIQGAQLRSITDNRLQKILENSQQRITSGAFSPNGEFLALGVTDGATGAILMWRVADGRLVPNQFIGPAGEPSSISFSPDGQLLAAGWTDGVIQMWRVQDGQRLRPLLGHGKRVQNLVFSGDGLTLASAGDDNRIGLWRMLGR